VVVEAHDVRVVDALQDIDLRLQCFHFLLLEERE
jgi:hypothetical protein